MPETTPGKVELVLTVALLGWLVACHPAGTNASAKLNGRWNIEVKNHPRGRAWWLKLEGAETARPRGWFVGAPGGGLYEIPELHIRGTELEFVFERNFRMGPTEEPQHRRGIWRARLIDDRLEGTFQFAEDQQPRLYWTGYRAPEINDRDDGSWVEGEAVELFNGKDLSGWLPMIPGEPLGWEVKDGLLTNNPPANNLVSERKFWNFILKAEYRLLPGTNSGIGLRGRYEVQILDDYGKPPTVQSHGAIYSRIAPSVNASRPAGEWQELEVRLIGREVTVQLNGQTIIDHQEIEGLTAMASDPFEDQPGPITLQGDHRKVEFRRITVIPLLKKQ